LGAKSLLGEAAFSPGAREHFDERHCSLRLPFPYVLWHIDLVCV